MLLLIRNNQTAVTSESVVPQTTNETLDSHVGSPVDIVFYEICMFYLMDRVFLRLQHENLVGVVLQEMVTSVGALSRGWQKNCCKKYS